MRKLVVGFVIVALVVSGFLILTPPDVNAKVTYQVYFVVDVNCASGMGVGVSFFNDGEFIGSSYGCYNPV